VPLTPSTYKKLKLRLASLLGARLPVTDRGAMERAALPLLSVGAQRASVHELPCPQSGLWSDL